ncbi:lipoyl(octanoyl) transferase LipB [Kiritimatiellaeota bacterium B1221]|nr:lipoyl(octanoyl) transferase LipB [Kiritimatiellaeota bacterium B1221]
MSFSRFCIFEEPLPYPEAVSLQEQLVAARLADEIPDTFLLLQHPPVITLGRRGRKNFLLADENTLRKQGIEVQVSTRGGDVTYHGPGQWVLYPILKLGRNEMGAHGYLHALESVALQTAAHFGIEAYRKEGKAGAWCDQGKFSAIGFKFTRWVTSHGLSLNVNPDLGFFDLIVGCGLVGERVSSFAQVLGGQKCPGMDVVGDAMKGVVGEVFQRELSAVTPDRLLEPDASL